MVGHFGRLRGPENRHGDEPLGVRVSHHPRALSPFQSLKVLVEV